MEKKIEKLEGSYDVPQLKQKLNEIIDHLNSQDQEEEITAEQLCEDNRKRMERLINKEMEERGFIRKIKDTPEQKEELVEIKKKLNGISVEYNIIDRIDVIWEEIENLLSEREMFNKEELEYLNACVGIVWNKWKINGKKPNDIMLERLKLKLKKLAKLSKKK